MELILSDDYLNVKKNSYKSLSLGCISEDFSGTLNFTDYSRNSLANYRLEAGKVVARSKSAMSSSKGGRLKACDVVYNCYTIETTVSIGCCDDGEYNYNPTGYCCEGKPKPYTRYDTYCDTDFYCYPDPPTEPGGDDGGTTGPGDPSDENLNRITNNLTTPCLKDAMSKVQNAQFNAEIQNILQRFNASTTLNFTIKEENLNNDDRNAETVGNVITLNNVALANASQEFIAKVIYHEVLHVYLGGSLNSDHQTMATNYVDPLTQTLTSLFPNLSFTDAQALSWSGLKDTNAWNAFGQTGKDQILGIATQYKNLNNSYKHQYGTSCN